MARSTASRTRLDAARLFASAVLIWDRTFYDPEKRQYTVDRFLADVESRFGPIDAVLIWPVYPNLGVDDRNQFDLLRDMPGGHPRRPPAWWTISSPRRESIFPNAGLGTGTRDEGAPPWHGSPS